MQYGIWTARAQDIGCRLAIVLDCLQAVSPQSASSKIFFTLQARHLIHAVDTGARHPAGVEKIDSHRYHYHSFLPGRYHAFNNHDFHYHAQAICQ
jgi:hypothetical protein